MGPENFVIRFAHNKKPVKRKKHKLNKLIKIDIKLDLWAFVKVTRTNETEIVFSVLSKATNKSGSSKSISFLGKGGAVE